MGKLRYKGYSGTVEYDESANILIGKVSGLKHSLILYEGDTVENLKKDLRMPSMTIWKLAKQKGGLRKNPTMGNCFSV